MTGAHTLQTEAGWGLLAAFCSESVRFKACPETALLPPNVSSQSFSRMLKKPAAVIARRAQPGVAIQTLVGSTDFLDCFAALETA